MDSVREQYVHQLVQKTQKFEKTECVIMGAFDICLFRICNVMF